jgi:hypothetical protein
MAAPYLWGPPEEYKRRLGTDLNNVDTHTALLAEIYNQEYYNSTSGDMQTIQTVVSGGTYQNNLLIGKNVKMVFVDTALLTPTTDYTFDGATGTITFVNPLTDGVQLVINYTP